MGQPGEKTYVVVFVPSDQVTTEGCEPGSVKLTGTPGLGVWDEWGPYRCIAEVTQQAAESVLGVLRVADPVVPPGGDPRWPALTFGYDGPGR